MTTNSVLLIDDDVEFCGLLTEYLSGEGFEITAVHDGETGYQTATQNSFDLIILDVMLPKLDGISALKKIKAAITTPVLMLTAKGDETDQLMGLENGADDYLPKPCSPRLLVARSRAILRRTQTSTESDSDLLQLDNICINQATRVVKVAAQEIELTNSEYNILVCLINKAKKVVTKEELSEVGLNRKITAYDRSVDMHISHLRSKLGNQANGQPRIKTIRGIGYMLER